MGFNCSKVKFYVYSTINLLNVHRDLTMCINYCIMFVHKKICKYYCH